MKEEKEDSPEKKLLSEKQKLEEKKRLLKEREKEILLFKADELRPRTTLEMELEKMNLLKQAFPNRDLYPMVVNKAGDYEPMFPYANGFYITLFEILGWKDKDPRQYRKPRLIADLTLKYFYSRFGNNILPTILTCDNPYIAPFVRRYKLFQFLNEDGKIMLTAWIEEAVEIMKESKDFLEFDAKYCAKAGLPVQTYMGMDGSNDW